MDPSPKVKKINAKINKWVSQVALLVKNLLANAEDIRDEGSIPELGRYPGEGHGNPFQYSGRWVIEDPAVIYARECFAYVFLWEVYSLWSYI